jgi:DivIVA domain-containing protein
MAVTSIDARTTQFGRAPIGTRGYFEPEVDAFLGRVAATLLEHTHARKPLWRRVRG